MRKSLAERSGRDYPHNAIYEILTYRVDKENRNEPVVYNDKTVAYFTDVVTNGRPDFCKAYLKVYMLGYTLEEVAQMMKCSSTTVRKYLNEIFFMQDDDGFVVNKLKLLSKG